jgi:protein O-mannosyl-transferase
MTHRKTAIYIALFTLLIYANSLGGNFIGDDKAFVAYNRFVQSPQNFVQFFADPSAAAEGALKGDVYRPLTTLSYALDYAVWKLNSFGYHLMNAAFHAANSALVYFLILLISGDHFMAIFAGLLFSSQPVQTEAVSWISGRSNVLFLFFYLASLIFYILAGDEVGYRHCEAARSADEACLPAGRQSPTVIEIASTFASLRPRNDGICSLRHSLNDGLFILSVLCFVLSLFSKEMAVTLPLIIIAYDIHFSGRAGPGRRIFTYIPYFLAALLFIAVRSAVLGKLGQFEGWGDPYKIFLTMLTVVVDYMRILIFPLKLHTANYIIPMAGSFMEMRVLFSGGVLALLAAVMPPLFRRSRVASFSLWWFFITLLPVLNIVPIKAFQSERFLYLPSIGFCTVVAYGLSVMNRKMARKSPGKETIAMVMAFALIGAYSLRTIIRNEDWKNELILYSKMARTYPLSTWALNALGSSLLENEKYEEALEVYRRSVTLEPSDAESRGSLGQCYLKLERYAEAVPEFETAVRLNPQNSIIRNMLGVAYINLKRYADAKRQFRIAMKMSPEFLGPALNLGRLEENEGRIKGAVRIYASMLGRIETKEETAVIFIRIGDAYMKMLEPAKANEYYAKARALYGANVPEALTKILEDKMKAL